MKKIKLLTSLSTLGLISTILVPLTSCNKKDNTLAYINNQSNGVTFDSLPESINKNTEIVSSYETINAYDTIDATNSDILVNGNSIKDENGVCYTNNLLKIPSELVTGDITIKLVTKQDFTPVQVFNSSSSDISLIGLPETVFKGYDIHFGYKITNLNKTIDYENTFVSIGGVEYKNDPRITIKDNFVNIPGLLVRDWVEISIVLTDIKYQITNESDVDVEFEELPTEIVRSSDLDVHYVVKNDKIVDADNCDVLIDSKSIKSESGVEYSNGFIKIPGILVKGEMTIKIKVRAKKTFTVTINAPNITFDRVMPTVVTEKTPINANYTIDDGYELDKTNSDITIGGKSVKDVESVCWRYGNIYIPHPLLTGDVVINLVTTKI